MATVTGPPAGGGERWRLDDEEEFLHRSLADAEAEHAAGDLADRDYTVLVRRDRARLAEVQRSLDDLAGPAPSAPVRTRPRTAAAPRRRRAWLAVVGGLAVAAAAVLLAVDLTSPRLPGQSVTGSVTVTGAQLVARQLGQAAGLARSGDDNGALSLYRTVLSEEPANPQALAAAGWLEWQSGAAARDQQLASAGRALVARSLAVDPSFAIAHLYSGTIDLLGQREPSAAVVQYRAFLAAHPRSATVAAAAQDIRLAFTETGQPVPAAVADG